MLLLQCPGYRVPHWSVNYCSRTPTIVVLWQLLYVHIVVLSGTGTLRCPPMQLYTTKIHSIINIRRQPPVKCLHRSVITNIGVPPPAYGKYCRRSCCCPSLSHAPCTSDVHLSLRNQAYYILAQRHFYVTPSFEDTLLQLLLG